MNNNPILLQDFAVLPALYDDYGHYLLLENPKCFYVEKTLKGWKKRILSSTQRLLSFVEIVDKYMGVYSLVDQMVEEEGKYRCFLCPNRITQHCPLEIRSKMEEFCARVVLSTLSKYGLSSKVHTDYLWVGNIRYSRGDNKMRISDRKRIFKIKAILSGWSYLKPDSRFLSLNTKTEYTSCYFELSDEKKKLKDQLSLELKDVSLMWQCGLTRRQRLRDHQIFSFHHPDFLLLLRQWLPASKFLIVEKMLKLYQSQEELDFPSKERLYELCPNLFDLSLDRFLFVDFETDYQKCIYMFGYTHSENGYHTEWASDLCPEKEVELMHRIATVVSEHKSRGGMLVYFYAEDMFWRQRCKYHNLSIYNNLFSDNSIDLYNLFEKGPLLIHGVFNFKLKSIAKALYEKGKIPICQPEGCSNGSESITIAKRYFHSHREEDRVLLENYNRFDCDVLLEISKFLRTF